MSDASFFHSSFSRNIVKIRRLQPGNGLALWLMKVLSSRSLSKNHCWYRFPMLCARPSVGIPFGKLFLNAKRSSRMGRNFTTNSFVFGMYALMHLSAHGFGSFNKLVNGSSVFLFIYSFFYVGFTMFTTNLLQL